MAILTVNAGSSSLKLRLVGDDDSILADEELAAPRAQVDSDTLGRALEGRLADAEAVAHRIVHTAVCGAWRRVVDPQVSPWSP